MGNMTKSKAYRLLDELREDCPYSEFVEALDMAMSLLESEDLLTQAFDEGRLIFVKE